MSRGGCGPWIVLVAAFAGACETHPRPRQESYQDDELEAEVLVEETPPDPDDAPPAISPNPTPAAAIERGGQPPTIVPASHGDDDYASPDPVVARRYVYRVRMIVPAGLGTGRVRITPPAAELHVDVSHERLRARFIGSAWPIAPGSEVRLRRDRPGVYLFDDRGGRPLEPGELAEWFEGGPVTRRGPPLYIFNTYGFPRGARPPNDEEQPGELFCALLAELVGESRETVLRRCELGAPFLWRMGFWRAEQTAGVPVELPRSALRADERSPPRPMSLETSRAFLEPEALSRLDGGSAPRDPPPEGAPGEGLRVSNESADRAIIAIDGIAVGWVDRGAEGWFVGLRPGTYDVGSIRPLGAVMQRGRPVRVPGIHRVCDGRCPRRTENAD
ncbi:MAG: hypothetical protein H6719_36450 [Sandaracinaceae bacterium]|nr:hypothetical protein [Sandaracinaceae bacterium]